MSLRTVASWSVLVLSSATAVGLAANLLVERGTALLRRTVHDSVRTALREDAQDFALERDRIAAHETAVFVERTCRRSRRSPTATRCWNTA